MDVALEAAGIEHLRSAIGQCHIQIFLRLAIHRAITTNRTRLAAFLPVDNVALGRSVKAADHQLLLDHILNALDLQCLVFLQPTQAQLHHLAGQPLRIRL